MCDDHYIVCGEPRKRVCVWFGRSKHMVTRRDGQPGGKNTSIGLGGGVHAAKRRGLFCTEFHRQAKIRECSFVRWLLGWAESADADAPPAGLQSEDVINVGGSENISHFRSIVRSSGAAVRLFCCAYNMQQLSSSRGLNRLSRLRRQQQLLLPPA